MYGKIISNNNEVVQFLSTIWEKGEVREIRAFANEDERKILFGFFDSPEKAAGAIAKIIDTHIIYVVLNPCKKELIARAANRLKIAKSGSSTGDKNIESLRYILIDCDPDRVAKISSSQEEITIAQKVALDIKKNFGNPLILAMSGNGYHLIYRHALSENNQENIESLKAFLVTLAEKYKGTGIKIDTSVFNPERISKVIGTWARKGDSISERPHRQSRIIEINNNSAILQIPKAKAKKKETKTPAHSPAPAPTSFDSVEYVRENMSKHGIAIREEKPWNGGLLFVLEQCLFNPSHTNKDAAILVNEQGVISYQCFHDSCQTHTWADVKSLLGIEKKAPECKKCHQTIKFDPGIVGENGHMIPLGEDSKPHKCPAQEVEETPKTVSQAYAEFLGQHKFSRNMLTDDIYIDGKVFDDFERAKLVSFAYDSIKKLSQERLIAKLMSMADESRFNPIQAWTQYLPEWDRVDRIEALSKKIEISKDYLGIHPKRVLEIWLCQAFRRWLTSQQSVCLVLQGEQGIGKDTLAKWLCPMPDFYLEKSIDPDSKDDKMRLISTMIWNISELGATTRRQDIEALKSFMTLESVRDRKPYGHTDINKPTFACFIASSNPKEFLADESNRRFLVLPLVSIDFTYTGLDQAQFWAQVKAIYEEKAEMSREEKEVQCSENKEHRIVSCLDIILEANYIADPGSFVSSKEVLDLIVEAKINVRGNDMAIAIKKIGGNPCNIRINGIKTRGYRGIKKKYAVQSIPQWNK